MVAESSLGKALSQWRTLNDIEFRTYTASALYGIYEAAFPGVKAMNRFAFEDIVELYHLAIIRTTSLVDKLNTLDHIIETRSLKLLERTLHHIIHNVSYAVITNNTNAIIVHPYDDEGQVGQKTRIAQEIKFGLIWIDKKIFAGPDEATSYIWERLLEYYKEDTEVVAMLLNYRNQFSYYFYGGDEEMAL